MPQVTRADIETKVSELVNLITAFHGWDMSKDSPIVGGKGVLLQPHLWLYVFASPIEHVIKIVVKPEPN